MTDPDHIWNATPNVKIQPRNHHFNNTTKQKLIYIIPNKNKQNIGAEIRTAQLKTIMVELEAMAHWMYLAPIQPETFLVGISKKQFQTSNKYHNQPAHETEHVATLTKHRRYILNITRRFIFIGEHL